MKIDFNPHVEQKSTTGRPFRVSGAEKINPVDTTYMPYGDAWIKYDYMVSIKYLDDNTFAKLKVDSNGKILKVIKDKNN